MKLKMNDVRWGLSQQLTTGHSLAFYVLYPSLLDAM